MSWRARCSEPCGDRRRRRLSHRSDGRVQGIRARQLHRSTGYSSISPPNARRFWRKVKPGTVPAPRGIPPGAPGYGNVVPMSIFAAWERSLSPTGTSSPGCSRFPQESRPRSGTSAPSPRASRWTPSTLPAPAPSPAEGIKCTAGPVSDACRNAPRSVSPRPSRCSLGAPL